MKEMQSGQPKGGNLRDSFAVIYWVASGMTLCFTPFVRCGFGVEGIGFNGVFALILLVLLAGLANSPGMMGFAGLWVLVVLYRRLQSNLLQRRGVIEHSRYSGRPFVAMKLVGNETVAKTLIDPLLCFVTGLLLLPICQPLGQLLCSGVSLAIVVKGTIEAHLYRMRVRRLRDAQVENMQLVNDFRH